MSINRGTDKEDVIYIYLVKYYSPIKKNKIMPSVATWMDLKTVILSHVSQTQKVKHHMILLIAYMWNLKKKGKNEVCIEAEPQM